MFRRITALLQTGSWTRLIRGGQRGDSELRFVATYLAESLTILSPMSQSNDDSQSGILMNSRRALYTALIGLLIITTGCGGDRGNDLNSVAVSVSPTTGTTTSGGQVTLQATVTGLSGNPALNWTIAELQTNGASGAQCNWLGSTPPSGSCPDGTIQGADAQPATTVTYHVPSGTGTFHINVQWSSVVNPVITKTATSVVTVTP
jgi:hypothetical protein